MKLAPDVELEDDWYAVQQIDARTFAIGEPAYHQQNWSYLLLGEAGSLLFDTGSFCRDITGVVGRRATLPLTVLPSHMHFDHLGNVTRFNHVAVADLPVLRDCVEDGVLTPSEKLFLGAYENNDAPSFAVDRWIAPGEEIDLGGRRVKVLHTPGHSSDSISLHIPEEGRFFAADFIYPGTLYGQVPGASLPDYLDVASVLANLLNDETTIFCAHGNRTENEAHSAPVLALQDMEALVDGLQSIKSEALDWEERPEWTVRLSAALAMTIGPEAIARWR
ncbi:MAG: MBL fold metallo-hydrolase [Hyphomicrobiales bacterium]